MIQIEEAIKLLKEQIGQEMVFQTVSLLDAYGCITGEDSYSAISVPPFSKSAMDGYAVRSVDCKGATKDTPVRMKVIGEIMAGDSHSFHLGPMEAVRIMTGGMVPALADCIIKQEDTDYGSSEVIVYQEMAPFENYCKEGEDLEKGSLAVPKYTKINSVHIGILASLGIPSIKVIKPLKVAIAATGSELNAIDEPLRAGKIYNSCSYMIAAKLRAAGLVVTDIVNCKDDLHELQNCIELCAGKADVIITTGGVSVGVKDLVPDAVKGLGAKILFHRINVKPGTPVMGSVYQGKIILSLSGNPFAALTTFELLFWPIAAEFMKNSAYESKQEIVRYEGNILKVNKMRRYVRAYESEGIVRLPSDIHASSVLSNMTLCNCLIEQPEHKEIKDGEMVNIIYINEL